MIVDISDTLAAKIDQMTGDDLLAAPRTFTITEVRRGPSAEQPVEIVLAEFDPDRPFRPGKSMRRVIVGAWGADTTVYIGRRMTLYRDPSVKFGGAAVGGIRVSHLSDIDKPLSLPITVTKGKKAPYKVDPLPDLTPIDQLRSEYRATQDPDRRAAIAAEVEALQAGRPTEGGAS